MKTAVITIGVALGLITLNALGAAALIVGAVLAGWLVAKVVKLDDDINELGRTLNDQKEKLEEHLNLPAE